MLGPKNASDPIEALRKTEILGHQNFSVCTALSLRQIAERWCGLDTSVVCCNLNACTE